MADTITIALQSTTAKLAATTVIFVTETLKTPVAIAALKGADSVIARLARIENFKAKAQSTLIITGVPDLPVDRLVIIGLGNEAAAATADWVTLGGIAAGHLKSGAATIIGAYDQTMLAAGQIAEMTLGMRMRNYSFDKYKTKKKEDEAAKSIAVSVLTTDVAGAKRTMKSCDAIAQGVNIARELVNEPPNVLNPVSFAKQAADLAKLGVEVDILDHKALQKLGMRALLAVGQGSRNESRVAIMRWNGAKSAKTAPVAFVGKGVTFDTGGISIKPAGGMEDMKGDMAGAACVTGLMHALAARKAKVNAVGVIGLVENMPDGMAQRPGDIVTSMSGQTIEIINTDAEGRLVLADVLWHTQAAFKPQFMVDLATLTGAILVALGQEHAGLFSNNDVLAEKITAAGKKTGERVWRMPLDPAYDKIIDSKFADVKNSGGRFGGSITAAQFLQRFVNDCPWAHLDIAGTGMASNQTEINRSWGSGWGVRLLNQMVADHYEDQ
ncbi:MAG: leucyl aminopeptidase [Beijerinckiaceae bacterium]